MFYIFVTSTTSEMTSIFTILVANAVGEYVCEVYKFFSSNTVRVFHLNNVVTNTSSKLSSMSIILLLAQQVNKTVFHVCEFATCASFKNSSMSMILSHALHVRMSFTSIILSETLQIKCLHNRNFVTGIIAKNILLTVILS